MEAVSQPNRCAIGHDETITIVTVTVAMTVTLTVTEAQQPLFGRSGGGINTCDVGVRSCWHMFQSPFSNICSLLSNNKRSSSRHLLLVQLSTRTRTGTRCEAHSGTLSLSLCPRDSGSSFSLSLPSPLQSRYLVLAQSTVTLHRLRHKQPPPTVIHLVTVGPRALTRKSMLI